MTINNDGNSSAMLETNEPKTPADLKPANVATLRPTGPGVMLDIASISTKSFALYHLYCYIFFVLLIISASPYKI